jgi:hypothetical protein
MEIEKCNRCDKKLNPKKTVWLEYDQRVNGYTDRDVPANWSQGGFAFGQDCATILKREYENKTAGLYECAICQDFIGVYEICEKCAKNNDPFPEGATPRGVISQ